MCNKFGSGRVFIINWPGVALHQDVAKSILALSVSAAGPHGHRTFVAGLIKDFGTGAVALKHATLRSQVHKVSPGLL